MFNFIDRFGFELEGGWDEYYEDNDRRFRAEDGSVSARGELFVGELVSPPFNALSAGTTWLTQRYPDHVDASCGFHIHISLKNSTKYCQLLTREFQDALKAHLLTWAKENEINEDSAFYRRMNNQTQYAKWDVPTPQLVTKQILAETKNHNRYTAVNYCYGLHKTLELRILPMFVKKRLSASALQSYLTFVEQYLATAKPLRDKRPLLVTVLPDETVIEELEVA